MPFRVRTALLLLALGAVVISGSAALAQTPPRFFAPTGHTVGGLFLQYWNDHGALPQQGYPLTQPFQEKSDLNGQTYTVQYFERAVFEEHPENQPPYNVLLSQLGTFRYKARYPNGAPGQQAAAGGTLFKETGFTVGGPFLAYWQTHGGLAQQGYPISNEFQEKSELNGQTYRVQYFERAVFEAHPENQPPYDVLLSQLGTFQLRQKYPTGIPGGADATVAVPTGVATAPATGTAAASTVVPTAPVTVTAVPTGVAITPATSTATVSTAVPTAPATATASAPTPVASRTGTNCEDVAASRKTTISRSGDVAIRTVHAERPEYVEIANLGAAPVVLTGWTLRDRNETDQSYTFTAAATLAAGASLQVYTEPGHPYTFNSGRDIWNNCGDALELVNASGSVVATYAYGTHLLP